MYGGLGGEVQNSHTGLYPRMKTGVGGDSGQAGWGGTGGQHRALYRVHLLETTICTPLILGFSSVLIQLLRVR